MKKQKKKKGDDKQMFLPFAVKDQIKEITDRYNELGTAIGHVTRAAPMAGEVENEFVLRRKIADSVKSLYEESGLSKDTFVDRVNAALGRTVEGARAVPQLCKNPLTVTYFEKYLNATNPIPSYFDYAFFKAFGRFPIAETVTKLCGGNVVVGNDVNRLMVMKAEELEKGLKMFKQAIKV